MSERVLPTVGFDRFVTLEWMNYALDLALLGQPPEVLRSWLSSQITGPDAIRKTYNVLSNLWLIPYPQTQQLRQKGIELAQQVTLEERLVLHWGMALANFALFRTTTQLMGRLMRLQGDFRSQEIISRVLEQYSNANTAGRAAGRIIQSVATWGVISNKGGRYRLTTVHEVLNPSLTEWLMEAVLLTHNKQHQLMVDLLRTNELFPFDVSNQGAVVLHKSNHFIVSREGLDQEVVRLTNSSSAM